MKKRESYIFLKNRVEFNIDAHMPSFLNTIQIKYRAWSEKVVGLTKDPNEEQIYGEGWERLGYQRPLGKFLYSFGLLLPQIVLALAVAPLLKYTQYRFPEIGSFDAAAGGLFGGLYSILDLDTQPVMDRFLPQYAISDPRKAMQYVTFFIKNHMQTGLFQIAFVAIYVLYVHYSIYQFCIFSMVLTVYQYSALARDFRLLHELHQFIATWR